jgi:hypothetical protein
VTTGTLTTGPRGSLARTAVDKLFSDKGILFDVAAESEHHETSIEFVRAASAPVSVPGAGCLSTCDGMVTVRPLFPRREWPILSSIGSSI